MTNLYKKTDIKTPKNAFAFVSSGISFDSIFTDFQKFAYTIQLAEQIFLQKHLENSKNKMTIWVKEPEKFIEEKENLENFFTSFFEYDVSLDIAKDDANPPGTQSRLVESDHSFDFACLFSGGLDSGTYAIESNLQKKSGILHHTITHDIPYGKAKKLYSKHLKNSHFPLTYTREENKVSQPLYLKTRGLIFLTNLLCIASYFKTSKAIIPENGPFMVNVAISPSVDPTRTTDPYMIKEWTEIFNRITNSNISIETPYFDQTKSDVIIRGGSNKIIQDTWSCSYFQGLSKMCGMCNSCLVRILSCYAINEGENLESSYTENPFLITFSKLKITKQNSYRVSLDGIDFWAKIINPSLARNTIEKIRFETIRENHKVMINHSLDMFLGFENLMKKYQSREPLFLHFKKMSDKIETQKLKNRFYELEQNKEKWRWK